MQKVALLAIVLNQLELSSEWKQKSFFTSLCLLLPLAVPPKDPFNDPWSSIDSANFFRFSPNCPSCGGLSTVLEILWLVCSVSVSDSEETQSRLGVLLLALTRVWQPPQET